MNKSKDTADSAAAVTAVSVAVAAVLMSFCSGETDNEMRKANQRVNDKR